MATLQILPVNVGNNKTAQVIVLSPPRQPVKILPKEQDQNASAVGGVLQTALTPGGAVLREHTKKRIHFSKKALTHPRPQSVVKRNTRERNRIKAVNQSKLLYYLFFLLLYYHSWNLFSTHFAAKSSLHSEEIAMDIELIFQLKISNILWVDKDYCAPDFENEIKKQSW